MCRPMACESSFHVHDILPLFLSTTLTSRRFLGMSSLAASSLSLRLRLLRCLLPLLDLLLLLLLRLLRVLLFA